jgi:hypothetical protein
VDPLAPPTAENAFRRDFHSTPPLFGAEENATSSNIVFEWLSVAILAHFDTLMGRVSSNEEEEEREEEEEADDQGGGPLVGLATLTIDSAYDGDDEKEEKGDNDEEDAEHEW